MGDSSNRGDGGGFERTVDLPMGALQPATGPPRTMELEVVGGPMDGHRTVVHGSVATIGRAEDNDLVLALDATISTRHARIVREGDHYWLEDLGSRNGTFLGDVRIRERALIGPGTLFAVGRTRLEFSPR
jgi:pSer/pThr/pTyr-binding forkhead associated (FHA) protein